MNVRYQADADLVQAIVTGVLRREPKIDFQTATQGELEGIKDPEVLSLAAQQSRILITHDRKTMPAEFARFIIENQSAGVIIVSRKTPIEIVIEELVLVWAVFNAEEWGDDLWSIGDHRIANFLFNTKNVSEAFVPLQKNDRFYNSILNI